jgi:Uma2 family endonuclease
VFARTVELSSLKGLDVLLAVEVGDSSLAYDLGRKAQVYAEFGVRELWVIDAARRVAHVHLEARPGGYERIDKRRATERLEPAHAPTAFAFALDDLEPI